MFVALWLTVYQSFTFSFFSLFSLSILFHDWQRAFLVNQPSFSWFQHFQLYSSSSPHNAPNSLHPTFPPLFCCCAISSFGWWSNQCSNQTWVELGLNSDWNLTKYGNTFLETIWTVKYNQILKCTITFMWSE